MNIGVIIVSTDFINDALLKEIDQYASRILVVCFGLEKQKKQKCRDSCSNILHKNNYKIFYYSKENYISRKYSYIIKKCLKILYASCDYFLCLHGESYFYHSLENFFEKIKNNSTYNIIEQNIDARMRLKELYKFTNISDVFAKIINKVFEFDLKNRFSYIALKTGHDAWGLSKKTVFFILKSDFSKCFYRLLHFSANSKNYFIHTCVFYAGDPIVEKSLELYFSNDYQIYNKIFYDTLTSNNIELTTDILYYPASHSLLTNYIEKYANLHDHVKNFPAYSISSRVPVFMSDMINIKIPILMIYSNNIPRIYKIFKKLDEFDGMISHGFIDHPDKIDYITENHIHPRYPSDNPHARDACLPRFIFDLIYFYQCKYFSFAINLENINNQCDSLLTHDNIISLFILDDYIFKRLKCISFVSKSIYTINSEYKFHNKDFFHACIPKSVNRIVNILNFKIDLSKNPNFTPPLILPKKYFSTTKNIANIASLLFEKCNFYYNLLPGDSNEKFSNT